MKKNLLFASSVFLLLFTYSCKKKSDVVDLSNLVLASEEESKKIIEVAKLKLISGPWIEHHTYIDSATKKLVHEVVSSSLYELSYYVDEKEQPIGEMKMINRRPKKGVGIGSCRTTCLGSNCKITNCTVDEVQKKCVGGDCQEDGTISDDPCRNPPICKENFVVSKPKPIVIQ